MLALLLILPAIMLMFLYVSGHSRVQEGLRPGPLAEAGDPAMRLSMIVAMTGTDASMPTALRSLARQNYPAYEMILVLGEEDDPAMELARELAGEYEHCRVTVAGRATGCSRKNHNLLHAVGQADSKSEAYVFCDSTHVARADFLAHLVAPLQRGDEVLTTGWRCGRPQESGLGVLMTAFTMQLVQLLLTFQAVIQPWGGATAIRKETFHNSAVPAVWKQAVLDDMPLGIAVKRTGGRCCLVPQACLETPLRGIAPSQWWGWWYRQLHYTKFYVPSSWALTTVPAVLLGMPLLAAAGLLLWIIGLAGGGVASTCFAALLVNGAAVAMFRKLSPVPVSLLSWIAAGLTALVGTALLYVRTWTSNTIRWRGTAYRVGLDGKVREIIETE